MKNKHVLLQLCLYKQMLLTNNDTLQVTTTTISVQHTHNFPTFPKYLREPDTNLKTQASQGTVGIIELIMPSRSPCGQCNKDQ
jgi:hypothetical protein